MLPGWTPLHVLLNGCLLYCQVSLPLCSLSMWASVCTADSMPAQVHKQKLPGHQGKQHRTNLRALIQSSLQRCRQTYRPRCWSSSAEIVFGARLLHSELQPSRCLHLTMLYRKLEQCCSVQKQACQLHSVISATGDGFPVRISSPSVPQSVCTAVCLS